MGDKTAIEWTDATWNPVRGCSRVSPGCENCYAERVAARFSGPGQPYEGLAVMGENGPRWTRDVRLVPEHLADPLRWRKPRRVFVNSMSDLFHESLPDEAIDAVFAVMLLAPQHTFQVLTKRPDRMRAYVTAPGLYERILRAANRPRLERHGLYSIGISNPAAFPAPWIWLGVSVEDQQRADERIPDLLATPAALRFLSVEPLLGPVALTHVRTHGGLVGIDVLRGLGPRNVIPRPRLDARIDWVIVGGESGPGARPCDVAWIRSVVEQCLAAGVAVFCKQLGADPVIAKVFGPGTVPLVKLRDRKGGDPSEWPEDLRVQEFPR